VKSLTIGIVDAVTTRGTLLFGMFALLAEYEAAPIRERAQAGLRCPSDRPRTGPRTSAVWRPH
jgi:hypothetical protein